MPWYPKATKKAVAPQRGGPKGPLGEPAEVAVIPCASAEPSLVKVFPAAELPHFYVRLTGNVEQYRAIGEDALIVVATQGTDPAAEPPARQATGLSNLLAWIGEENRAIDTGPPPLVWLHGPDGCNECELRCSIRAITATFPHGDVWIVGYAPPWVDRDKVRVIEISSSGVPTGWGKHHQLNRALAAACEHIPGPFVVCHDDHFPMTPDADLDLVHVGEGTLLTRTVHREATGPRDPWTYNHRATLDHLTALGRDPQSLACFEVHRPMLVEGARLGAMLAATPQFPEKAVLYKSLWGNLCGWPARQVEDHKAKGADDGPEPGQIWVSTNESSFRGALGQELRRRYADPSPYERADMPPPETLPYTMTFAGKGAKKKPAEPADPNLEVLLTTTIPGARDNGAGQISRMQGWLNVLGYACGNPPGHYGRKTQRAVDQFHRDNGCLCGPKIKPEKFLLLQRLAAAAVAAGATRIVHPHQAKGLSSREAGAHLEQLAREVPAGQAIVELGVFHGRTLLYLAKGSAEGNRVEVHGVDPWDLPGERYPSAWKAERRHRSTFTHTETRESAERNVRNSPWADVVHLHREFSVPAGEVWAGPPVGLLHIDGNHNYPDARDDFDAWRPHLAPGAVVVWDDWDDKHPGVQQSLAELVERGDLTPPQSAPGAARLAVTKFLTLAQIGADA